MTKKEQMAEEYAAVKATTYRGAEVVDVRDEVDLDRREAFLAGWDAAREQCVWVTTYIQRTSPEPTEQLAMRMHAARIAQLGEEPA